MNEVILTGDKRTVELRNVQTLQISESSEKYCVKFAIRSNSFNS